MGKMVAKWSTGLLAVALLGGCSSEPEKAKSPETKKETPKQEETALETGRSAFQRMYVSARTWAPDVQLVRMESYARKEDPKDGRASSWSGVFVSASKQNVRNYSWSGAGPEAERGVQPGSLDYYSPANASTRPFDLSFLKVDTTKAVEVANQKGGAALLKKNPEQPIKYMLFFEPAKARLLWRVIYGNSLNDAKLKVLVNATNGDFVLVEK